MNDNLMHEHYGFVPLNGSLNVRVRHRGGFCNKTKYLNLVGTLMEFLLGPWTGIVRQKMFQNFPVHLNIYLIRLFVGPIFGPLFLISGPSKTFTHNHLHWKLCLTLLLCVRLPLRLLTVIGYSLGLNSCPWEGFVSHLRDILLAKQLCIKQHIC